MAALTAATAAPAGAAHPDDTSSAAIYRIPYDDGTNVDVTGDAHNHGGPTGNRDRIDMVAVDAVGNGISPSRPSGEWRWDRVHRGGGLGNHRGDRGRPRG